MHVDWGNRRRPPHARSHWRTPSETRCPKCHPDKPRTHGRRMTAFFIVAIETINTEKQTMKTAKIQVDPTQSIETYYITSSTARGGGGSFKKRKTIGEIGCCESRMPKQKH